MLSRVAPRARQQLLRGTQSRSYTAKKGAESSAASGHSRPVWLIIGGAAVVVSGIYGTLIGSPRKVAEMQHKMDPDTVAHMNPKQGGTTEK